MQRACDACYMNLTPGRDVFSHSIHVEMTCLMQHASLQPRQESLNPQALAPFTSCQVICSILDLSQPDCIRACQSRFLPWDPLWGFARQGACAEGPGSAQDCCVSARGCGALQLARPVQVDRSGARSQPQVLDDKERKRGAHGGCGVPAERQGPAEAPRPQMCTPAGQQTEATGERGSLAVSRTCVRAGCMA